MTTGKLTSHFTLEMLSNGISEHETFQIFLGEHAPRPPYIPGGSSSATSPPPPSMKCVYAHDDCLAANADFSAIGSNTLAFPSGTSAGDIRCISVNIIDDTSVENDELFTLSLQSAQDATVVGGSILITIQDTDSTYAYLTLQFNRSPNKHAYMHARATEINE